MEETEQDQPPEQKERDTSGEQEFADVVERKETRRKKRQEEDPPNIWFGMGMFGLVGWSVALPAVLFLGLGMLIDRYLPGTYSWTLTGLLIGVVIGCANAWHWVSKESRNE